MSRRPLALALSCCLTLGLLAGCGDDVADGNTEATAPSTTVPHVVSLTPLTVELVDAGAEPRAVLAHDITEGTSWTGDLTFDLAVETVTTVAIVGESHLDTESVSPEGTVTGTYGLLDLDVSAQSSDPATPAQEGTLDITGQVVVGPDRTATAATVSTAATGDLAGIDAVAEGLDPRLSSLLFPFPTEPIGTGAEWAISGPLPLFGTDVVLEANARLDQRQGGQFAIAVTVSLTTPEDQDGPQIDLSGIGQIEGDVGSLGLDLGSIVTTGSIVLLDRGPDPLPMTMELHLEGQ